MESSAQAVSSPTSSRLPVGAALRGAPGPSPQAIASAASSVRIGVVERRRITAAGGGSRKILEEVGRPYFDSMDAVILRGSNLLPSGTRIETFKRRSAPNEDHHMRPTRATLPLLIALAFAAPAQAQAPIDPASYSRLQWRYIGPVGNRIASV